MVLAYIDTNVFLDFYQSSTDRLRVFEDILERATNILLTEQTVAEFRRNRVARLTQLAKAITASAQVQLHTTAVVQELPGFKDWIKAKDEAKKAAIEIANELKSWIDNEPSDLVLAAFEKLVAVSVTISTSEDLINRARTRKLLGQPPTSPDKYTVGDELNWECLLTWTKSDIVIVTRDRTFLDNQTLLKNEFSAATGRSLLKITDSLAEGLEQIGQASEQIKAAEEVSSFRYIRSPAAKSATLLRAQRACEMCGINISSEMDPDGPPYLEVHHVIPLSAGGLDTPENMLALCPNCHRKIHFSKSSLS